jgi:hypothetical protein
MASREKNFKNVFRIHKFQIVQSKRRLIKETKIADLPDFDVCGMLFKCIYDDRYLFFPPSWFI